jgi:hypothetical protein
METLPWGPGHPLFASYDSLVVTTLDIKNLDIHADEDLVR